MPRSAAASPPANAPKPEPGTASSTGVAVAGPKEPHQLMLARDEKDLAHYLNKGEERLKETNKKGKAKDLADHGDFAKIAKHGWICSTDYTKDVKLSAIFIDRGAPEISSLKLPAGGWRQWIYDNPKFPIRTTEANGTTSKRCPKYRFSTHANKGIVILEEAYGTSGKDMPKGLERGKHKISDFAVMLLQKHAALTNEKFDLTNYIVKDCVVEEARAMWLGYAYFTLNLKERREQSHVMEFNHKDRGMVARRLLGTPSGAAPADIVQDHFPEKNIKRVEVSNVQYPLEADSKKRVYKLDIHFPMVKC